MKAESAPGGANNRADRGPIFHNQENTLSLINIKAVSYHDLDWQKSNRVMQTLPDNPEDPVVNSAEPNTSKTEPIAAQTCGLCGAQVLLPFV